MERVPDHLFDFKPHEKSNTMGWLANHLADLPFWLTMTLERDELDLAPTDGQSFVPKRESNIAAVLERFDRNVSDAQKSLSSTENDHLMQKWALKKAGQTLIELPRYTVIRNFSLNHMVHHRAQLGLYLRLNNLPVPAIYGPSADEGTL